VLGMLLKFFGGGHALHDNGSDDALKGPPEVRAAYSFFPIIL
jgi:hypothetical protein